MFPETNRAATLKSSRPPRHPKKRPDYKEEIRSAQGICRLRNEAEARRDPGFFEPRQVLAAFGITGKVPVVQHADSLPADDQHRAFFIEIGLDRLDRRAAMVEQGVSLVMHDERRV